MPTLTCLSHLLLHIPVLPRPNPQKFELELRNFHKIKAEEVASHLDTSLTEGLASNAAAARAVKHGKNVLSPPRATPMIARLGLAFVSGFTPLLWVAALFVFLSWEPFGTAPSNVYNLMLAIVLLIVITFSAL